MESDPLALYEETRRRELPRFCRHMLHDYSADQIIHFRPKLWAELEHLGIAKEVYPHGLFGRPARHSNLISKHPVALESIDLMNDSYAVATRETCEQMYFPGDEDWERYLELYYPFADRDNLHKIDYFLEDRLMEKNLMVLVPARNERPYLPDPLLRLNEWQTQSMGAENAPKELLHLISRMRGELFNLLDEGTPPLSYQELFPQIHWDKIWEIAKQVRPMDWREYKYGVEVTVRRAVYAKGDPYTAVREYFKENGPKKPGHHKGMHNPKTTVEEKYFPLRRNGGDNGWRRRDDAPYRHTFDEVTVEMTERIIERWQESA